MTLPNLDRLVVPIEKLTKYALDTVCEPNKSLAFKLALSFDENDTDLLIEKIKLGVALFTAEKRQKNEWGAAK